MQLTCRTITFGTSSGLFAQASSSCKNSLKKEWIYHQRDNNKQRIASVLAGCLTVTYFTFQKSTVQLHADYKYVILLQQSNGILNDVSRRELEERVA